jgi:hypothetical protein
MGILGQCMDGCLVNWLDGRVAGWVAECIDDWMDS